MNIDAKFALGDIVYGVNMEYTIEKFTIESISLTSQGIVYNQNDYFRFTQGFGQFTDRAVFSTEDEAKIYRREVLEKKVEKYRRDETIKLERIESAENYQPGKPSPVCKKCGLEKTGRVRINKCICDEKKLSENCARKNG